jgi:penicillin-binding protein 2
VSDRSRFRLVVLQVLVVSLLITLAGRLWYVQIRNGGSYTQAAASNHLRAVVTPAVRGQILDDQGRSLVDNKTGLVVTVSRTQLMNQKDGGKAVLARLAPVLGMPLTALEDKVRLCSKTVPQPCWNGSPYQPITVASNVSTDTALTIVEQQEKFPGVAAQTEAVRDYPSPYGINAAQALGYLTPVTQAQLEAQAKQLTTAGTASETALQSTDLVGASGLEQSYDSYLRGKSGITEVAVDNLGRVTGTVQQVPAAAGDDLVSTLDARVQATTEQQLVNAILAARQTYDTTTHRNYVADSGAAVVMDIHTGRVLAMTSYPSYNPDVFTGGISQSAYASLTSAASDYPLLNRVIQGEYAPGSTFKVISSSAALQDGFSEAGPYNCSSSFSVGGRIFKNSGGEQFGPISLEQAITVSCDTVFYGIAYQMYLNDGGPNVSPSKMDPIQTMAKDFGLSKTTGVDLSGEAAGEIQTHADKIATWAKNKDLWCYEAKVGFPDTARTNPSYAAYLQQIAADNCQSGGDWLPGDAINESIGQAGILVTPLQLARVYAAIANGGALLQPQLARAILSPSGKLVKDFPPVVQGRVPLTSSTLAFLHTALATVPAYGTAAPAFAGFPLNQIPVAAKTGTAEVYNKQTSSVFASYAPANNPEYVIVMVVSQGGYGVQTSGVAVEKIYESLFGVHNGTVNTPTAIFPGGGPSWALPTIKPDGTVVVSNAAFYFATAPGSTSPGAPGLPYSEPPYPYVLKT